MKRRERLSGNYLEAFDQALEWAAMRSGGDSATVKASQAENGNRRSVKRRERLSRDYLEPVDQALEWALMGTGGDSASGRRSDRGRPGSGIRTGKP